MISSEDAEALQREAYDAIATLRTIITTRPEVLDPLLRLAIKDLRSLSFPLARPVVFNGNHYASRAELAAKQMCSIKTVHSAVFRRDLKTIMGRRITIDGITYPTKRAASRALGIPYSNLRDR